MVEIKNLFCGYNSKIILQNINLSINNGELVGIIGPNGSGKTTLLRSITRVIKPKKGVIIFENKNIWEMKFKELAKNIAVVPQSSLFSNFMTVEEFVLLGRIPHFRSFQFLESKKDLEVAERCMVLTDTLKLKNQLITDISGGERQLVLIAKALAQEPKFILLDEPTAHLDINHQIKILDLIKKLNKEFGLTVAMVLHDLNLASEYCDKLFLMNEGKIYKSGKPHEVLTYQIIEEVYKTLVIVKENPLSGRPYVFLVSKEMKSRMA